MISKDLLQRYITSVLTSDRLDYEQKVELLMELIENPGVIYLNEDAFNE